MSSYNPLCPELGCNFLYQHHMTWGSTSCLLTGHLSDLIAFMCQGAPPPHTWLGLQNQPCPRSSPPCTLPSSQAPPWVPRLPGHGDLLLCHTTEPLPLCSSWGARPTFLFWMALWMSGTYSDSPENLRLVAKETKTEAAKHSKDKILKRCFSKFQPSLGSCLFHTALLFFLGFWLIHFFSQSGTFIYLFIYFWA